MSAKPTRVAVVGTGHLGTYHAEKYAAIEGVDLVAVVDVDIERARALGERLSCGAKSDYLELIGEVDCVSVAVPTSLHRLVAGQLLEAGIDCLVEKPLAASSAEAEELVGLARANDCILQVGHLERFNPALIRLAGMIRRPRFVECHRLAPFTPRGADVDVVRDLMIHDLDLIALLQPAEIVSIDSVGIKVLTQNVDLANVRLRFADRCVANLTASRVSAKRERKLRLFQSDLYITIDLGERKAGVAHRRVAEDGTLSIEWEDLDLGEGDALEAQIRAFVASVQTRARAATTGEDGTRALHLCERILASMETE
ncbi:MAG: Gfo/Idh/MocA family oxidoreductase [Deltaproteobacteria bacterium]